MFTGTSGSRLLHPKEFIESRNEADAMVFSRDGALGVVGLRGRKPVLHWGHGEMVVRWKLFEEPQQATHDSRPPSGARQAGEDGLAWTAASRIQDSFSLRVCLSVCLSPTALWQRRGAAAEEQKGCTTEDFVQLPQVMSAASCAGVWINGPMTDVRQRSQTERPVRKACDERAVWAVVEALEALEAASQQAWRRLLDGRGCSGRARAWAQGTVGGAEGRGRGRGGEGRGGRQLHPPGVYGARRARARDMVWSGASGSGKLDDQGGEREGARYHLVSEFAPTHPRPAKANYKRSPAGCANGGRWARSSPTRFMLAKRGSHHAFWN